MSSRTTILAHVPVDEFEIVDGPTLVIWLDIATRLDGENGIETRMRLKTGASEKAFWRKIVIHSVFKVGREDLGFTGIFCGQVVGGLFNHRERTGWFNLE